MKQDLMRRTAFVADVENLEVRDSGAGDGSYTIRGHAAVFNKLSLDLGGFQEKIDPGAFANVLNRNPDVLAVWDHDTRYTLARTLNNTLELREDPYGLHNWMRVAPTSYAADLRVLMERGDINQASFMFTIARERAEWGGNEDDPIVFTIEEVGELYDVTVTGRGAYPQTDQALVNSRSARLENALREGRVPGLTLDHAREIGLVKEDTVRTLPATPDAGAEAVARQVEQLARARAAEKRRKAQDMALRVAHAKSTLDKE